MIDYRGKKIVIIGLGLTGLACVKFFISRGVIPYVMDTRLSPPGLNDLPASLQYHIGSVQYDWLLAADLIVISPGVAMTMPELREAAKAHIEIISDIELFCREAQAPIVAITGSNGKSTVTTLLGEMAKAADLVVGIGGNIGIPALNLLHQQCHLYVLELSSFQLEATYSLQTAAATMLNITADHMDRYPLGLPQYHAVKSRVYDNASICVVNADDPLTLPICRSHTHHVSFGVNKGNYHLHYPTNKTWLWAYGEKVLHSSDMKLIGIHNYTNALAALALADAVNIPRTASLQALTTFTGLPHRFQLVWEYKGISWINDSKSTNIGSTKAAINSLEVEGTLHLLLGGDGKSANFSPLMRSLNKDNIRMYCFGRDGVQLAKLCPSIAILTDTMEQAMRNIVTQAQPGDIVLLSPACASFDQFKNFEMRGNRFAFLAQELTK